MSTQDPERSAVSRAALIEEALRRARAAQSEYLDARANVADLRFLRLQGLADEMAEITKGQKGLDVFMTLKAVPGDPPRLIVDAMSHVVMEPDPRTYMLIYDGPEDRKILCETESRRVIEEKLTEYVAHQIVAQERTLGTEPNEAESSQNPSASSYLAVWCLGVVMGALALFAYINADKLVSLEIFRALTSS